MRIIEVKWMEWRWCLTAFSTCQQFDGTKLTHFMFVFAPKKSSRAYVLCASRVCFTLCLRIRIENDNNHFIGLAKIMESTNRRRRQKSYPCNGLRPIIRLWGIVTSIGKHWKERARQSFFAFIRKICFRSFLLFFFRLLFSVVVYFIFIFCW